MTTGTDYLFLLGLLIMVVVIAAAVLLATAIDEVQQDVKKILERLEKK